MGFNRGASGNPGGRPKGAKGKKSLIKKELDAALRKGDWQAVLGAIIEKAKRGDMAACRLLVEYRWGKPVVAIESDVTVHTAETARQELETAFGITYVPTSAPAVAQVG